MTTAIAGSDHTPAPSIRSEPDTLVVYWPEPSHLRPWWDTIMGPAMPADPAVPRSPDPRHPRARNPHLPRSRPARSATHR
ncbi:hypothetical protein [Nocardia niigatensis]|uniref:hypothetical protein n=1 Tax=Nocardia niigatensis TaxID=209249 RepID=UPI0002F48968|nr:hypothetical protein [Nocardia niigatensis]